MQNLIVFKTINKKTYLFEGIELGIEDVRVPCRSLEGELGVSRSLELSPWADQPATGCQPFIYLSIAKIFNPVPKYVVIKEERDHQKSKPEHCVYLSQIFYSPESPVLQVKFNCRFPTLKLKA
jgi:hypothetical protein